MHVQIAGKESVRFRDMRVTLATYSDGSQSVHFVTATREETTQFTPDKTEDAREYYEACFAVVRGASIASRTPERRGIPTFTKRVVLAHYDCMPMLITASSDDGRLWGCMTLADTDRPEGVELLGVMFEVSPEDFIPFETETRDPLKGDYLRDLMQKHPECWWVDLWPKTNGTNIHTILSVKMLEPWLPTTEAESQKQRAKLDAMPPCSECGVGRGGHSVKCSVYLDSIGKDG